MSLSRRLDQFMVPGAIDELAITKMVNDDIGRAYPHTESLVRYGALTAVVGSMIRYLDRRRLVAVATGRFVRTWKITQLTSVLWSWIIERHPARLDPDADMLRINLLRLQINESTGLPAEVADLSQALAAMTRIGNAGSRPMVNR